MKRWLLFAVSCALHAAPAMGAPPPKMIYARPPLARIEPLDYPQFGLIDAELRNTVRRHGDRSVPNTFCAVGYRLDGGTLETVLIWDDAQWLIRWWGGDELATSEERYAVSASFSAVTDLRADVVEDARFPLGTRTVVRADAQALIADCRQNGRQYTVPPLPAKGEDDDF
ncbi:hypothetical protein [Stenotrophomonas sp. SY1]|uniref:hypothetical protein n=1 Tax=Stenotrophomonas sp. SY1 TaxID=477235 RepID=UPI001E5325C5|nr:hypothetical protein [Stenotrophomonas sp. SY1]MCD9087437.1 hypothetical protein [Stenotrophomonas sp. SY1]